MAITHTTLVTVPDDGTSPVGSDEWNAAHTVGDIVRRHPETRAVLRAWAQDDDVWVRRAALLAELIELRSGRGDFAHFATLAVPMLGDKSFWIRKAIGWVLRDVSKKRPELTRDFVAQHGPPDQ